MREGGGSRAGSGIRLGEVWQDLPRGGKEAGQTTEVKVRGLDDFLGPQRIPDREDPYPGKKGGNGQKLPPLFRHYGVW